MDNDFYLPPVSVTPNSSGGSKSNRILGPDGQLYTQGEAAKLGLIIRTACEACRNRKLKCSGTLPENGGCERCNSDNIQCVYSARAPIGRPKKRKVDEGQDLESAPGPASSSSSPAVKAKSKRRTSPTNAVRNAHVRVKTEDSGYSDSPFRGPDRYSTTDSPAIHHTPNSAHLTEPAQLSASPAQGENLYRYPSQHGNATATAAAATFESSRSFNVYGEHTQSPGVLPPSGSTARFVSTPTVWSQNQVPFTMTPTSESITPQSIISPAAASTSFANGQSSQSAQAIPSSSSSKLPSLDDLSVAAFLQSLDTLEISPAELFQHQQQQQQIFSGQTPNFGTALTEGAYGLGTPFDTSSTGIASHSSSMTTSSVEEWATSSAILQPGLSFAVPADFSWWDLGINGTDVGGSTAASVVATPSTEPSSLAFPSGPAGHSRVPSSFPHGDSRVGGDTPSTTAHFSPAVSARSGRPRRPTFSADQSWPRGADAGMGQGQIQHTIAATETGLGWSTLPGSSLSSPAESQPKDASERTCCSSKSAQNTSLSPSEVQRSSEPDQAAARPSGCCSSKTETKSPPKDTPQVASCCSGKGVTEGKEPSQKNPSPPKEEIKSCCSSEQETSSKPQPSAIVAAEHQIEMGPLSTSAAVTGPTRDLDAERKRHAALHSHHPSKVHCVPNPSGRGCTCLCDMSVALLSVKQVLRETDPHKASSSQGASNAEAEPRKTFATETIQLTLTASQAITAQCACSADCPTCQSDPSTEISASLLVSTALQIYARAVRILREGFAASAMATTTSINAEAESQSQKPSSSAAVQSFFGGLDVTIGTYKPSASNAKKIALYAIKLELKDLRRALGKISRMAQNFNSGGSTVVSAKRTGATSAPPGGTKEEQDADGRESSSSGLCGLESAASAASEQFGKGGHHGMNPIDQLVILKLYRQLTELLKTVEGLEDAA